jgi:hypothetical protein
MADTDRKRIVWAGNRKIFPLKKTQRDEERGCRLVVMSGYKAGLTLAVLPKESIPEVFATPTNRKKSSTNEFKGE